MLATWPKPAVGVPVAIGGAGAQAAKAKGNMETIISFMAPI